ncbi:MAG: hypothetical protein Q9200_000448 [Gallowayella weberi]
MPSLSIGFAALIAASTLVVAEPLGYRHKPAQVVEVRHVKRQDSSTTGSSTTTSQTSGDQNPTTTTSSTSSSSSAAGKGGIINVNVVQPSLCSEKALQFSSAYPVATGTIQIHTGLQSDQGWGVEGSIWNITANEGVQLNDFRVPCQGSSCTGITGNKEEDGSIVKNADGSWTMNVTANMQPSVALFGTASGGTLGDDGTFDLTVTSTPPCALPVFQNCSGRKFDPTADQWNAYSTDSFLAKYLTDNNINSLESLLSKASNQFLPTTSAQQLICNPDAGEYPNCDCWARLTSIGQNYDCTYPENTLCDAPGGKDATAGFLVVAAVVRMSQMLSLLVNTIQLVQGDISTYITQIVVKFFQPQAEQEWQSIVTAVSSIIGLFVFVAILIDGFTGSAATPLLVAATVGIQSALAAAANFKNGFEKQKPDSTYLAIDGNYSQSAVEYARGLEEVVNNVWTNSELGQEGIKKSLSSGAWLSVGNPYNVTGITEDARDWLDNILVTSYINRVFQDADAYIVFLPYKKYTWHGVMGRDQILDFNQDECANHWANDPGWPYYATCDIPVGEMQGMGVLTRPVGEGKGSKTWSSGVEWTWASEKYKWNAHDMMSSAITGFGQHGFGYNLTNTEFAHILDQGSQAAIDSWKTLPLNTPGLFTLPVCILGDIHEVPGGHQVSVDVSLASGLSSNGHC